MAENWRVTASAGASETFTTNSNYAGVGPEEADFITSVTAGVQISGEGARARLNGSIAATGLFYAKETQNNSFAPTVSLTGSLEAIEKFFYLDGQVSIYQTFYSPLGAQPGSLVNATANRYTSQNYRLSPYIQGRFGGTNATYLVRDDNIWSTTSQYGNTSVDAPGSYFNEFHASLNTPAAPLGWTVEYIGTRYASSDSDTFGTYISQVGRAIATYQVDPSLEVSARGGYESERFPLTSSEGMIYGGGLHWAPSDRTLVSGFWEHRFFGSSYSVEITHRLPRTSLSATFSRGITTYPQNALSIPAGANVAAFVDAAFATRIPDPAERALAVQQFIAQSNLPSTLSTPINVFTAQVQLQTAGNLGAVLVGARNSVAANIFYLKTAAISAQGSVLPPPLQFGQNTTQTGGGISFNHRLSGLTNLTAAATYSTTKSNETTGVLADSKTKNSYASLGLSTQLAPRTSGSMGVNYNRFVPTGDPGRESSSAWNVFAAVNHTF